jgi:hypothetical protein
MVRRLEQSTRKMTRFSAHSHSEEFHLAGLRQRKIEDLRVR